MVTRAGKGGNGENYCLVDIEFQDKVFCGWMGVMGGQQCEYIWNPLNCTFKNG